MYNWPLHHLFLTPLKGCATRGEAASINGTGGLRAFWAPEANTFKAICSLKPAENSYNGKDS